MIRKAKPEDASRLAELIIFAKRAAYRPIFRNDHVSFNEMRVLDLALRYRDGADVLRHVVVYDDGIVKGMLHWGCTGQEQRAGVRQLKELYVDPFFQGEGVGRALLDFFLETIALPAGGEAYLWVLEQNARARRFYEAAGLLADGTRELEPGTEAYLLRYRMRPCDAKPEQAGK